MRGHVCMHTHAPSLASPPPPLTCARLPAGQDKFTSLIYASFNGHVEAMRVLIEKGALIEAADKVRIHSQATTHARSQTLIHTCCTHWPANAQSSLAQPLIHTRMHTLARERTDMILFNLTHNAWAHVHAHACTVACVAAAAPDLRTLAGWVGRPVRHR
jgi:hypothetical protein